MKRENRRELVEIYKAEEIEKVNYERLNCVIRLFKANDFQSLVLLFAFCANSFLLFDLVSPLKSI